MFTTIITFSLLEITSAFAGLNCWLYCSPHVLLSAPTRKLAAQATPKGKRLKDSCYSFWKRVTRPRARPAHPVGAPRDRHSGTACCLRRKEHACHAHSHRHTTHTTHMTRERTTTNMYMSMSVGQSICSVRAKQQRDNWANHNHPECTHAHTHTSHTHLHVRAQNALITNMT